MSIPGFTPKLPERDTALHAHPLPKAPVHQYAAQLYDKLFPGVPYPAHWDIEKTAEAPASPERDAAYETVKSWAIINQKAGVRVFKKELNLPENLASTYTRFMEEDGILLPSVPGKPREFSGKVPETHPGGDMEVIDLGAKT